MTNKCVCNWCVHFCAFVHVKESPWLHQTDFGYNTFHQRGIKRVGGVAPRRGGRPHMQIQNH